MMADAAATSGTFSEVVFVKTRSVCKLVIEVPIEQADMALKALGGVPQPGKEVHVAVARLELNAVQPAEPEKPKQRWQDLKYAQQAGIRCGERRFQEFLIALHSQHTDIQALERATSASQAQAMLPDIAASAVRAICEVESRAELNVFPCSERWENLDSEFRKWAGMEPEER